MGPGRSGSVAEDLPPAPAPPGHVAVDGISSRHFPFPQNLRSSPGGPGRMPLPDRPCAVPCLTCSAGACTPKAVLHLLKASGHKPRCRPVQDGETHFIPYLQPLRAAGNLHHQRRMPLLSSASKPHDNAGRGDTSRHATRGRPSFTSSGTLSQAMTHTSLRDTSCDMWSQGPKATVGQHLQC